MKNMVISKAEAREGFFKEFILLLEKIDFSKWKRVEINNQGNIIYITLKQKYGGYTVRFYITSSISYQVWGNEIVREGQGFEMNDKVKYLDYERIKTLENFNEELREKLEKDILSLLKDLEYEEDANCEFPIFCDEYEKNNYFTFDNSIY